MRIALILAVLPLPAFAQSLTDRYVAAQEGMTVPLREMFEGCAPDLATLMPDIVAGPALREASACVIEAQGDRAEAFVLEAEGVVAGRYATLLELAEANGPITLSPETVAFTQECGMVEASTEGAFAAFMRDNLMALQACYR